MSELSFVNNIAAGVDAVGLRNAPVIFGLAKVQWNSVEDRDAFLAWVGEDNGE